MEKMAAVRFKQVQRLVLAKKYFWVRGALNMHLSWKASEEVVEMVAPWIQEMIVQGCQ